MDFPTVDVSPMFSAVTAEELKAEYKAKMKEIRKATKTATKENLIKAAEQTLYNHMKLAVTAIEESNPENEVKSFKVSRNSNGEYSVKVKLIRKPKNPS